MVNAPPADEAARRYPRARCNWRARCVTEAKKQFASRTVNISLGGVAVTSPIEFPKEVMLYFEVQAIFGGRTCQIKGVGKVVHTRIQSGTGQYVIGLEYLTDLPVEATRFIDLYVKVHE
ncbi:MAG: PilZ domain-containing protein [Pseudomonadota bacterium]